MSAYFYPFTAESADGDCSCGNNSCGYPAREVSAAAEVLKAVILHLG